MMEPLEDRSELVALGLLQVTGSESIFTHEDCKTNAVSGGFSGLCTHCLLRQLISEHHPNKAVRAQHQWPTCTKGLSLAGPRPRLGGLHIQADAPGSQEQPCRKHLSMRLQTEKSRAGCPQKVLSSHSCATARSSSRARDPPAGPSGWWHRAGLGCDTHRCRAEGTAAAPLITPLPALPQGPPPFLSRFATRCLPVLAPHMNSPSPKGCAPTCLVRSTLLNPQ